MARSSKSFTPDQLLRTFDEAPLSNVLPSQVLQSKFFSHPPLLPGEQIIAQADRVTCVDTFNFTGDGVLHITTYRVIFAGSCDKPYYSGDQQSFDGDVDLEEVAKRGHYHQSRSRHSSLAHSVSDGYKNSLENEKKQDKWSRQKLKKVVRNSGVGVVRGLRNTQSVKGKKLAGSVHIAAFADPSVKLHTLRPVVLSNLENIDHSYEVVASIPLTSISDVRKFSKKNLPKDKQVFLVDGFEILCSNIQSYRFCLSTQSNPDAEYVMKTVLSRSKTEFSKLFAFTHKSAIMLPKSVDILEKKEAPNFYSFIVECKRLKVFETADWKQCPQAELPQQYPSKTLISSVLSPYDVAEVAAFHRGKCFPALCWRHSENGAVMLRSSATVNRRGLKDSRCKADEKYLSNIASCSVALKNKLVVFTEQMRQSGGGLLNSSQQVTQMTGQLTPQEGETFYYPNTRFVYGDSIADVKAVRQSACKLQVHFCSRIDDSKWLSSLDDTDWLHHISELLRTATRISVAIDYDKSSVLISYEEGIDRTAQLSSLSQLLLDPYYRTLSGFQVLIQKEWLAFGHRFYDRNLLPQSSDEHGPVFLQWLDCVWQVHRQFPFSFQFNELLLQVIAEHLYSSRFGTFLANSEMEREEIEKDACSLWTWLNVVTMSCPDKFINPRYNSDYEQRFRVLHPQYRIAHLKLWSPFFVNQYRHDHVHDALKAAQLEAMKLEQRYKDLIDVYSILLNRLADVDSADYSSKVSFYSATLHDMSRVKSADQLGSITSDSSSSLNSTDALSSTGASVRIDLAEEDSDFLASSMNSSCAKRRMTRSRSLDDMLHADPARQKGQKRSSLKRRVGSSKFYTEALSEKLTKEPASDLRNHPISEKYSSLMEYLDTTGIDYRSEPHVKVLPSQCCGYMVKQGQVRKNWKKRWFVLDLTKTFLAYFETDKEESPKGAIKCNAITRVYERNSCGKGKRHFLFCVDTADRTYTINAPSEQSMHIWINCLRLSPTAIEVP